MERHKQARGLAQAALGAVAHDRVANLPGGREPDPGGTVRVLGAGPHLHHHAGPGEARRVAGAQKIAPLRDPRGAIGIGWRQAGQALGRQPLAALGAAAGDDQTAALGRHARAETVAACANEFGRLECTFHGFSPNGIGGRSPGGPKCEPRLIRDGQMSVKRFADFHGGLRWEKMGGCGGSQRALTRS